MNAPDDRSQTDAVYNYDLPGIAKTFHDASTLQWESIELYTDFSSAQNDEMSKGRSPYGECIDKEQSFTQDDFNQLEVSLDCINLEIRRKWLDLSLFSHPQLKINGYCIGQVSRGILPKLHKT